MDFKAAGSLIRAARKRKQWNQRTLAAQAGIDFTYVSKMENGSLEYAPKLAVLEQVATQLALDLSTLKRLYGLQVAEWLPSTIYLPDYAG